MRTIADLIEYTNIKNIPGLILHVDFEKSINTVECIFNQIKYQKHSFQQWVYIMYSDITIYIINNGYSTSIFKITRGVQKGRPLSPYLSILCVELMIIAIRPNTYIQGIKIGE